jgi:predicted HTH transcriptional regulator
MKLANEWNEAYLQELISIGEQEGLRLDYKASAALDKADDKKNEISKDVSAFANSAGGFLVYGMLEDKHVPTSIDAGVDRNVITKERLESVIKSRIFPIIDDFTVKQISLPSKGPNQVAYVVEIAQATSRAPHQAYDHRYYKRYNYQSTPMEDYEVRDLMRRSIQYGRKFGAAWELDVEVKRLLSSIEGKLNIPVEDLFERSGLIIAVSNDLRTSGDAMQLFSQGIRQDVAVLVAEIDQYNSRIQTNDTGHRTQARVTTPLREVLQSASERAQRIITSIKPVLDAAP